MDRITLPEKLKEFIRKYKYVLLVLGIGLLLMMLPQPSKESENTSVPVQEVPQQSQSEALEQILGQIEGVGKVKVLLSEASGAETIYQTDTDKTDSADSGTSRVQTVIVADADRDEQGLVRQVISPEYLGAIVVCQGAERASVRLSIVEAVSNATGISADRITVLKMK